MDVENAEVNEIILEEQDVQEKFTRLINKVKYQDYAMPFGRCKGWLIADIKKKEKAYFNWMLENLHEGDLLEAIRWHAKEHYYEIPDRRGN